MKKGDYKNDIGNAVLQRNSMMKNKSHGRTGPFGGSTGNRGCCRFLERLKFHDENVDVL